MLKISPVMKIIQPRVLKNVASKPVSVKKINVPLIGIAMIGTVLLSSCSKDVILDELSTLDKIENLQPDSKTKVVTKKFDEMLKKLGLLTKNANSYNETKTISFSSDEGCRYYLAPISSTSSEIKFKQFTQKPDYTGESSSVYVKSFDDGLRFVWVNQYNQITSVKKYRVEPRGIVEYRQCGNTYSEESVFNKTKEGNFVQKFSDGTIRTFSDIKNNEEMPKKLPFEIIVDDIPEPIEDTIYLEI